MALSKEQLGKPIQVRQRIEETGDAVSLALEIPEALKSQFAYRAGQFVTFFMEIGGETLNRSYSISSAPGVDPELRITVKKVRGGRASNFLCDQVKVGDTLMTAPPAGQFFKGLPATGGAHYYLIAAGSGITPIFSILKSVLKESPSSHVTLLYGNRDESSIIYRQELERWQNENPDRLKICHVLSKPSLGWTGARGRITRELLASRLKEDHPGGAAEFYLCGPKEFMGEIRESLVTERFSADKIHSEDFAISLHRPGVHVDQAWTLIGDDSPAETAEKIVAVINGESVEVNAKPGQNILETLLEAGANPPYSCMDGACMACLAKIESGRVYQDDPGILTEENIAAREILTCQAKPLSRVVRVTFDDL